MSSAKNYSVINAINSIIFIDYKFKAIKDFNDLFWRKYNNKSILFSLIFNTFVSIEQNIENTIIIIFIRFFEF
jgi:hypothetical protein